MPEYAALNTTESVADAFAFLKTTGTLVRMVSERAKFERLIVVTDVRSTLTGRMVVLDVPEDLESIVFPKELPSFRFEYTGPDGLKYIFRCERPDLRRDGLWIAMPEFIERIQRRSDYRVIAPLDCWLALMVDDMPIRAKVLDISVGGVRCHMSIGRYGHTASIIQKGMKIVGLDLHIPRDGDVTSVHVHTGRIEWLTRDTEAGRLMVAISFQEMERIAANRLTREIYRIQRNLLRLRQPHQ
ncbi:MAG: PilZ domain-containing protein [Pseudomonadota bacterium]